MITVAETVNGYLVWNESRSIEAYRTDGTMLRPLWTIPEGSTLEDAQRIAGEILDGNGPMYSPSKSKRTIGS